MPDRAAALRARLSVRVLDAAGCETGGFTARVAWTPAPLEGAWDVVLQLTAEADRECAVRIAIELERPPDRFLVPGCLYPEAVPGSRARHPRWTPGRCDNPLASPWWSFAADRASHPAVLAWAGGACTAIAAREADGALGLTGLGFHGDRGGGRLWLDYPAREGPVAFDGRGPRPGWTSLHRWRRDDQATIRLTVYRTEAAPHAYDPLLRLLYDRMAPEHAPAPWMDCEEAAALAAEGLLRHHWMPEHRAMAETRGFQPGVDDRDHMHSAWLSGAPVGHALLEHGRRAGDAQAVAAAAALLDNVEEAASPSGLPWACWRPASGWGSGWTRPGTLHARTAAETVLFLGRSGRPVGAALDAVERAQRRDGAIPALFQAETGAGLEWAGTAGLAWVAPLAEGGRVDAARRAGDFYGRAVEEARLAGAPEDVALSSTSEDGYAAVMSYAALHRATGERRWLELARTAAAWTMTFRWAHNIRWPRHTLLDAYGFRTRGADAASSANPHLHAYGLICLPELQEVAMATGDAYLLERARDNLTCFRQMLAREDGDFNALRGMATERYFNTRAFGPKGSILPVSHAWCLGVLLHACNAALRRGEEPAFPAGAAGSRSARRP